MRVPLLRGRLLCLAALGLLATATPAQAQASAVAEGLFDDGVSLMEAGDYDAACEKLRESDRLEPAPGTKLNLALCEEKRGRVATALSLYRSVAERLGAGDERQAFVTAHIASVEPRVPRLVIKLDWAAPRDTHARIGSIELSGASFDTKLPFDPGEHTVVVTAPGRKRATYEVHLEEGKVVELTVAPKSPDDGSAAAGNEKPEAVAAPAPASAPQPAPNDSGFRIPTAAWIAGGVGAAGLVVGTVTGVLVLGKRSDGDALCPDVDHCTRAGADAHDDARALRTISNVGWAVGIVGVGVGAYFVITGQPATAHAKVGASAAGGDPVVSLSGAF